MDILRCMGNGVRLGVTVGTAVWAAGAVLLLLTSVSAGITSALSGKRTEKKSDRAESKDEM